MDFYFTNKKIKKICYSLKFLDQHDYNYFLVELTLIVSIQLNANYSNYSNLKNNNFTADQWKTIVNNINKNTKLNSIFNKLIFYETTEYISCDIYSPESENNENDYIYCFEF